MTAIVNANSGGDSEPHGRVSGGGGVSLLQRLRTIKWRLSFIAKYVLLLLSLFVCAVVLGVSVKGLLDMRYRLHAATSLQLLSRTALAVAEEPWSLNHGHTCADACGAVDGLLRELERWESVTALSVPTLRATLATARAGAVAGAASFATALHAYEEVADALLRSLRRVFATQNDGAVVAQVALDCVVRQAVPVFQHVSVLSDYLIGSWDASMYMRYVGTGVTHAVMINCSDYLTSFNNTIAAALQTQLPYLHSAPVLSFAQVQSLPDDGEVFTRAMAELTRQVTQVSDDVVAHWRERVRFYVALTVIAAVACALLVAIAVTAPVFLNLVDPDMSDSVFDAYARVESKTKLLAQYARSITTLTENDKLERLVGDTFLRKIDIFVRHARPCIAPTCFGDIEVTSMLNGQRKGGGGGGGTTTRADASGGAGIAASSTGGGVGAGAATAAAAATSGDGVTATDGGAALATTGGVLAADENGMQELRTALGLRPAYCTLLCIATMTPTQYTQRQASASAASAAVASASNTSDDDGDASVDAGGCPVRMDSTAQTICQLVASVERVAAAHRGVVHAVRGDYVLVTWNVVSTCLDGERSALHTALDLMLLYGNQPRNGSSGNGGGVPMLSMSIASGVVLAGTIDDGVQRLPMLYGAVVTRCEQMELLNTYLDTTLLLDQGVARKLASESIRGYDFCVVPVALFGRRSEVKGQQRTAHAVYPVRMNDALRAWVSTYKDLLALLRDGKTNDALHTLQHLRRAYSSSGGGEHATSAASGDAAAAAAAAAVAARRTTHERAAVGKLIDFWQMLLSMYMERNERIL